MTASGTKSRFSALSHRNFVYLWLGLIVSNTGTWMQNVAQAWLVLQLTNSPLWLGILGFSFALPMTVGPLFSGAIIDRVDRIRLLKVTQTLMMVNAFALAALAYFGVVNVLEILASSFIGSLLLAFDNPARQSLIPDLVGRDHLLNALSLNAATFNGASLVGPAIAGVMLGHLEAAHIFLLNGTSFLAVLAALYAMKGIKARPASEHPSFRDSILSGISYAWRNKRVLALLGISAVAAFFGRSYQNLVPVFARDIWHAGPQGYGLLLSAAGAGAIVGAFGLAAKREVKGQRSIMVGSGLLFSASLMAFAYSPAIGPAVALLFLAGVTSTVFITIVATNIQTETPPELRGRIMSLYAITLIGLPAFGSLGTSAVAEALGGVEGAPRAILLGAVVLALVLVVATPLIPKRGE